MLACYTKLIICIATVHSNYVLMSLLFAGYSWQACWLFECLWQLLFLVQLPVGMVACLVCLLSALGAMLYGLSRLYA